MWGKEPELRRGGFIGAQPVIPRLMTFCQANSDGLKHGASNMQHQTFVYQDSESKGDRSKNGHAIGGSHPNHPRP